jgi:hypothetical protein
LPVLLRRIFGLKRDEVAGEWRKLHMEKFNDLYTSPNIIRENKSRGMRCAGHVACTGTKRGAYTFLMAILEGKGHF